MPAGARPGRTAKKNRLLGLSIPMLLIGLGFLAGAYFSYGDQNTGPETTAQISGCSGSNLHTDIAYPTKDSLRVPIIFLVFGLPALFIGARALIFGAPPSWSARA